MKDGKRNDGGRRSMRPAVSIKPLVGSDCLEVPTEGTSEAGGGDGGEAADKARVARAFQLYAKMTELELSGVHLEAVLNAELLSSGRYDAAAGTYVDGEGKTMTAAHGQAVVGFIGYMGHFYEAIEAAQNGLDARAKEVGDNIAAQRELSEAQDAINKVATRYIALMSMADKVEQDMPMLVGLDREQDVLLKGAQRVRAVLDADDDLLDEDDGEEEEKAATPAESAELAAKKKEDEEAKAKKKADEEAKARKVKEAEAGLEAARRALAVAKAETAEGETVEEEKPKKAAPKKAAPKEPSAVNRVVVAAVLSVTTFEEPSKHKEALLEAMAKSGSFITFNVMKDMYLEEFGMRDGGKALASAFICAFREKAKVACLKSLKLQQWELAAMKVLRQIKEGRLTAKGLVENPPKPRKGAGGGGKPGKADRMRGGAVSSIRRSGP